MELGQVHLRSQHWSHLEEDSNISSHTSPIFFTWTGPLMGVCWIPSSTRLEVFLDCNLATVASSSWSNFLADPVSWPSPSTQATWLYCCFFVEKFKEMQNLEFIVVREVSWEVPNPSPNIKNTRKFLIFSNTINQPWVLKLIIYFRGVNAPGKPAHFVLLFRLHMFPEDVTEAWKIALRAAILRKKKKISCEFCS